MIHEQSKGIITMANAKGVQTLQFKIKGDSSLILHNGVALKDPLSEVSKAMKAISKKKNKTDEDYLEMGRLEWFASLYLNDKKQVVIPDYVLKATLVNAAKKSKEATTAKSSIIVEADAVLEYTGAKDIKKLYSEGNNKSYTAVKVNMGSSVMRTRPEFAEWALAFNVTFMPDLIEEAAVKRFVDVAGRVVGLGDWRPEHGRFSVVSVKSV